MARIDAIFAHRQSGAVVSTVELAADWGFTVWRLHVRPVPA